jgi:predicted flap endonuclease-1-like 5' DNA nuclease
VEEHVTWYVTQTLVEIVLAFLLGLLVGWLWWRRRKVQFSESDAVTTIATQHRAALAAKQDELDRSASAIAEKDLEIGKLSGLVSDDALELAARHEAAQSAKDEELAELTARLEAHDAEISRLAGVVDEAEAGASALHEELAAKDAELADKDAELVRLSTAADTVVMPTPAPAAAPEPVAEPTGEPTAEPTVPATSQITAAATPVEDTASIAEPVTEPVAVAVAAVESIDLTDAEEQATAGDDEPDELERVEGIGPRIGAALRGAGITTFRLLADAETETLQAALEQAGLRFAPSLPTWSRQAALLADGDEAGFVKLTESLVAGRDISGTKR